MFRDYGAKCGSDEQVWRCQTCRRWAIVKINGSFANIYTKDEGDVQAIHIYVGLDFEQADCSKDWPDKNHTSRFS
jgi:hypothetical protein